MPQHKHTGKTNAGNLISRYIWIAETIKNSGDGITLKEISDKWENDALNETLEPMSRKTFNTYKNAAEEMLGIDIVCDKRDGNKYHVEGEGDLEKWVLQTLSLNNLVMDDNSIRPRILLDDIPSGEKFLRLVIDAMKTGKILKAYHQGFFRPGYEIEFEPYAIKMTNRRWYVLAHVLKSGNQELDAIPGDGMRVYAMDRFTTCEATDSTFVIPEDFNASTYFAEYYGTYVKPELPVETILVRVDKSSAAYMRTLPWHPSQVELEKNEDYSIFSLHLRPTPDFIKDMAMHSDSYTIMKPQWVVNAVDEKIGEFKKSTEKDF